MLQNRRLARPGTVGILAAMGDDCDTVDHSGGIDHPDQRITSIKRIKSSQDQSQNGFQYSWTDPDPDSGRFLYTLAPLADPTL